VEVEEIEAELLGFWARSRRSFWARSRRTRARGEAEASAGVTAAAARQRKKWLCPSVGVKEKALNHL
jgi:hypothetical protein